MPGKIEKLPAFLQNGRFFITGTGTGVGKTFCSVILSWILSARFPKGMYCKPIQTGGSGLDEIFFRKYCPAGWHARTLHNYTVPASPHLSSLLDQKKIMPEKLVRECRRVTNAADAVIVEGAGGLYVPIRGSFFMLDLMRELGIMPVLAAYAGLGTLNHTLLSFHALKKEGVPPACIMVSDTEGSLWHTQKKKNNKNLIAEDNIQYILNYLKTPVIIVPHMENIALGKIKINYNAVSLIKIKKFSSRIVPCYAAWPCRASFEEFRHDRIRN